MEKYTFLDDLTSDVMFEAFGASLEEVFTNAASALFSVICDLNRIRPQKSVTLTIQAEDEKALLYKWLSTLLTESEIQGLFLCSFRITGLQKGKTFQLEATVSGEPISQEKGGTVAKGITYYGFKLEQHAGYYRAQVAVDI